MRALFWLLRALVFFVLFAFAINNEHEVTLKWFFGLESRTPMVLLVLVVFGAGCLTGIVAMLPTWWRQRRRVSALRRAAPPPPAEAPTPAAARDDWTATPDPIPRDGL